VADLVVLQWLIFPESLNYYLRLATVAKVEMESGLLSVAVVVVLADLANLVAIMATVEPVDTVVMDRLNQQMVLRVAAVVLLAPGEVAAGLVVTILSWWAVPVAVREAAVVAALLAMVLVLVEL
jgi:hypothetical protein